MKLKLKVMFLLIMAISVLTLIGCAGYEVNTGRGKIPGMYIRSEMQEADRALDAAKQAGKDKTCPAEFKAAEDARNKAYDVFRSCRTEEGAAMAKKAAEQAKALCPMKEPERVATTPVAVPSSAPVSTADTDRDGVIDTLDKCPGTPVGTRVDKDGCPEAAYLSKKAASDKICGPVSIDIKFDFDKSDIKPIYHAELKKLGDFLKENPKAKGTIEGHTDSIGGKSYNQQLSQRRAESVRNYIIKNFGIDASRIGTKGYGLTKPVADNKTKAGRAQNRRIEAAFNCE